MAGQPPTNVPVVLAGADGSTWDLRDPSAPVRVVKGSFSGLHLPPTSHQWSQAARVAGRRHKGTSVDAREVSFDVMVGDVAPPYRTGQDWLTLDQAWWAALSYETPATLRVGDRMLDVRLDEGNDGPFDRDDSDVGRHVYTVDLIADQPFWYGPDVVAEFRYDNFGQDYYSPDDPAALKYIAGSAFDDATVVNPGEEPVWPRYRIDAPYGGAVRAGVDDQVVNIADAPPVMFIDTHPRRRTILDGDGNNLWPLLGNGPRPLFAPIPAAGFTTVTIGMSSVGPGAGVDVTITPLYRRAW